MYMLNIRTLLSLNHLLYKPQSDIYHNLFIIVSAYAI